MANLTNSQIEKGKSLLKQATKTEGLVAKDRFALGRWAVEVCGPAVMGTNQHSQGRTAVRPSVEEAAESIGFAAVTLDQYRRVATQWGDAPTEGLSWSALRFLVSECKTAEARSGLILKARQEASVEIPTVNQLRLAAGKDPEQNGRDAIEQAAKEAAERAKAEAEAKHQKELADALARQKRESSLAEDKRRRDEAAKIRAEEQKKAAEAARKQREADAKKIAELEGKLTDAAKKAEFDLTTLTESQKAQVMTMLANDPAKATAFFEAARKERDRKNAEALEKHRQDAAKKREQMAEREARKAAERARQDYEGSALKDFVAITKAAKALQEKLRAKPVTFDHVLTSGMSAQEWVTMTELVEDVAVEVRESLFSINAEQELFGING